MRNHSHRQSDDVSTIVRLHDPARIHRLELALMSLCGQRYPFLSPVIVLQDFSASDEARVQETATRLPWKSEVESPEIVNLRGLGTGDHRSKLLNAGLEAATGRYIGFLDFDDYLYPDAYSRLIERIRLSGKKAAFGAVSIAEMDRNPGGACQAKHPFPRASSKYYFFRENCYPIHSFLLESQIAKSVRVPEDLSTLEDYYFLLSVLNEHDWDDELTRQAPIADYVHWTDESNTVAGTNGNGVHGPAWLEAREKIKRFKESLRITLPLPVALSNHLNSAGLSGITPFPDLSSAFIRRISGRLPFIGLTRRVAGHLESVLWNGAYLKLNGRLTIPNPQARPIAVLIFLARNSLLRPSYRYIGAASADNPASKGSSELGFAADLPLPPERLKKGRDNIVIFLLTDDGRLYRAPHFHHLTRNTSHTCLEEAA
jgi:hypothetical protein